MDDDPRMARDEIEREEEIFWEEALGYHGCPYQQDVNGDNEFRCDCTDEETEYCADDI